MHTHSNNKGRQWSVNDVLSHDTPHKQAHTEYINSHDPCTISLFMLAPRSDVICLYLSHSLSHINTNRRSEGSALSALAQRRTADVKVGRARSGDQLEPVQPGQGSGTRLRKHKQPWSLFSGAGQLVTLVSHPGPASSQILYERTTGQFDYFDCGFSHLCDSHS